MGRRRRGGEAGVVELVLARDWPVAAFMAILTAIVGFIVLPAFLSRNLILAQLPTALRPLVWSAVGFFSLVALFKYLRTRRSASRRRMHEYLATKDVEFHIGRIVAAAGKAEQVVADDDVAPEPPLRSGMTDRWESALEADVGVVNTPAKPTSWSMPVLRNMEWKRFEDFCAAIYREKGIRCETTSLGADGGVDIRLFQDETDPQRCSAIVQCKAWGERDVGVKPMRELRGVMAHEKIEKAFFMAPGGYTEEARAFANDNRITLLDGKLILTMIERMPAASQSSLLAFATEGEWTTPSCPHCGIKMVAREGRGHRFWGCRNFPRCRQRINQRLNA